MLRIIPHRALVEPQASVDRVDEDCSRAVLRVHGLVCSACAARVRRRLERLPGVRDAQVDLRRAQAVVEYDARRVGPDELVAAVEGAAVLRPARRLLARLAGHAR
jgi:copper chaperone CopZ